MTTHRWTKRHNKLFLSSAVIYALSVLIPIGVAVSVGQLQSRGGVLFTLLFIALGLFLAQKLTNRNSRSYLLSRTLKMEYEVAEYDFRMALKYKAIPYQRKLDEQAASHHFGFLGHNIELRLARYDLINGIVLGKDALTQPLVIDSEGVLVTIEGIDASNQSFADKLIAAVNEVDEQFQRRKNA